MRQEAGKQAGTHDETQRSASANAPVPEDRHLHELPILWTLAAVQFTNIVDFMIVMPLGPQLRRTLEITDLQFGLIVSSYTFAAGLSGLAGASWVDRLDRRTAFLWLYGGFLVGTLSCALAP